MTFGAVRLTARTIVGLVKFSIELAQDAINLERAITNALSQAMALAIDQAGLTGAGPISPLVV